MSAFDTRMIWRMASVNRSNSGLSGGRFTEPSYLWRFPIRNTRCGGYLRKTTMDQQGLAKAKLWVHNLVLRPILRFWR